MAIYETIFILDSLIPPKDIETTIQKYSAIITENGGKVREVDKWGKRRLAYEIQKKQYGFYVAIEFEGPGTIPRLLEADFNYNDKVLRFLTYRYDKNKLKAIQMDQDKAKAKKAESEPVVNPVKEDAMDDTISEISEEETETKDVAVEETESVESIEEPEEVSEEFPDAEEEGEEEKS
ncbi:MAG: 30S ribosomal protein S6 [Calditrichaceae bacterium]|nr:30S ribosomal protein S6 [Calditrichaceae bacterium]